VINIFLDDDLHYPLLNWTAQG